MNAERRRRDAASAANRRPPTSASAPRCSGKSGQTPSNLGAAASMTSLTSTGGWMSISPEGGPERRTYGP